ncbi:MAG: iron chaperone [Anaerolineales bacterium]
MTPKRTAPKNIDEYIAGFPRQVQTKLQKVRAAIRKAAPGAKETISYQIPAFSSKGYLIYFAAFRNHISLYPAP